MRVPWTARRSNQSILKESNPGCSLEGLMLNGQLWFLAGAADFISWGRFSLCPVGLAVPGSADSQVLNLSVFWVVFSLSQFLFLNHLKGVFEALPPYVCIWMVSSGPPVSRVVLRDLWCEMRTMGSVPSLPQCLDVFCRFRHTPRLTCVQSSSLIVE